MIYKRTPRTDFNYYKVLTKHKVPHLLRISFCIPKMEHHISLCDPAFLEVASHCAEGDLFISIH